MCVQSDVSFRENDTVRSIPSIVLWVCKLFVLKGLSLYRQNRHVGRIQMPVLTILRFRMMPTGRTLMKRLMILGCAAVAALFMTADTASAQCGYGGYGGYGGYRSGLSIGYSSFSPRTSFSIGYNNVPRYGYPSYRSSYRTRGYYNAIPTTLYRHGNHYHAPGLRGRLRY